MQMWQKGIGGLMVAHIPPHDGGETWEQRRAIGPYLASVDMTHRSEIERCLRASEKKRESNRVEEKSKKTKSLNKKF